MESLLQKSQVGICLTDDQDHCRQLFSSSMSALTTFIFLLLLGHLLGIALAAASSSLDWLYLHCLPQRPLTSTLPTGPWSHSSRLPLTCQPPLPLFPTVHWGSTLALPDQMFQKGFLYHSSGASKDSALYSSFLSFTELRRSGVKMDCIWACEDLNPHPEPKCQPLLLSLPCLTGSFPQGGFSPKVPFPFPVACFFLRMSSPSSETVMSEPYLYIGFKLFDVGLQGSIKIKEN